MIRMALFASFALLAACASNNPPEPIIRTVEVRVPVPVPCVDRADIPPERPYADERLMPPAQVDQMMDAMAEGITERDQDIPVMRGLLAACVFE